MKIVTLYLARFVRVHRGRFLSGPPRAAWSDPQLTAPEPEGARAVPSRRSRSSGARGAVPVVPGSQPRLGTWLRAPSADVTGDGLWTKIVVTALKSKINTSGK